LISACEDKKRLCVIQNCLIFPKKNRLLIPSEYQRVFKQGRKQRGPLFTFVCCANGGQQARLGVAIAKKHVRLAVGRNKIRRIIRETFRHHQTVLKGVDIVVITQKALHELSNTNLHKDLNQQWQILVGTLKASC
jgi:ribonuclease P protein component